MRILLLLSCVLAPVMSHDFTVLPKLGSGLKKIASDIGIIKDTPTTTKKEGPPPTYATPLAETIYNHPSSSQPLEAVEKTTPNSHDPGNQKQVSDEKQALTQDNKASQVSSFDLRLKKPEETIVGTGTNLGHFPPSPGSLSSTATKNNVTSIDKHGNVVFPDDTHRPDAAPVNTSIVCDKDKVYPAGDPCVRTLDGVKKVCADGASLDENNQCRPIEL